MMRRAAHYLTHLPRHPFYLAHALIREPLNPAAPRRVGSAPRSEADLPVWLAHWPILYLDDDCENVSLITLILERAGFTVVGVTSAMWALDICQQVPLSLVMTNIMMPDMDGYELCRRLKADPITCYIPLIFYTARNMIHDVIYGLEIGAAAYMTKPGSASGIYQMVRDVLLAQGNWRVGPRSPNPDLIARLVHPPDLTQRYAPPPTASTFRWGTDYYYTQNDLGRVSAMASHGRYR